LSYGAAITEHVANCDYGNIPTRLCIISILNGKRLSYLSAGPAVTSSRVCTSYV
jgi:hypothetical protein